MIASEVHNKIVNFLQRKGPSLPISIAKELGISSLFVSAFLSELVDSKRVKISNLKVGGSPLYFLGGQEKSLENFYNFFHPTEASTFLLLREKKILRDLEQQPAIRVALRAIKDFAVGFNYKNEIFWKFYNVSDSEINEFLKAFKFIEKPKPVEKVLQVQRPLENQGLLESQRQQIEIQRKQIDVQRSLAVPVVYTIKNVSKTAQVSHAVKKIKARKELNEVGENPLIIPEKPKKQKPKSEFVLNVIDFINGNGLKVVEEKSYKQKEYNFVIQIKSELGSINFLACAKDKKTISEVDLKKLLSEAQKISLPAFLLYNGEISKKGLDFLNKHNSLIKMRRVG